jgi:hypothetical protein
MVTYNESGQTYDDADFLWDGFDPDLPLAVMIGDEAVTTDYTGSISYDSLVATDNASSGRGTISLRLEATLASLTNVKDQALVKIVRGDPLNTETHRGFIRARRPISRPRYDAVEIIADDPGGLLDDVVIDYAWRPAESMNARISGLWLAYRPNFLDGSMAFVDSPGGTLEEVEFRRVTLRQAIESTIQLTDPDADYFVDRLGVLHVFVAGSGLAAPLDVDNDAPGAGETAVEELTVEYDTNTYANRVYVEAATDEASGYYQDDAAIAAADGLIRTASISAPEATTADMAEAAAMAYLERSSSAIVRGSFEITDVDGWEAGQNVLITDSSLGLSAVEFRIFRVTTRVIRPGSAPVFRYRIEFGAAAIVQRVTT